MFHNNGFEGDPTKSAKIMSSEPVEKTQANSFKKLLKNFASDTSFGGISKATLSDGHIRRFIWFLISATCYGFTIYMCYLLIMTYLEKPIKTSVDISYEKNIDFPSVTVCNLNQFRLSKVQNLTKIEAILRDFSNNKRNKSDGSSFENSVEAQSKAFKEKFNNDIDDDGQNIGDGQISVDEGKVIEELVAIAAAAVDEDELKNAGHQFHDMLLSCSWKGFDCKSGYFTKFWVQSWNWKFGNCFTFNPGADEAGDSLSVFRISKPGPNYGLSLDINIEQNQYVPQLTDEAGANIIIHNARQMPFPYDEGITVPPGFSSSIAIRKAGFTQS
ncbi:amiloride-sensitive sodium channel subunit gamma-2-like [Paramuricea clavata]|uniref:Amiloride-sensitive sodium channel subunit gamma-2-like n=1 Tax=Paramuricea clavata TaxID=317549 RepID=A0A6S7H1T3_PARCT|nr:amiloride-sensitive sodium channel subunit gamma-2-like [Paramuricea clavata]